MAQKRLRIFAGPNGSGKTILKKELEEGKYFSLYEYFNPDDILRDIQDRGFYELFYFEKFDKIIEFAINSSYSGNVKNFFKNGNITCKRRRLYFAGKSLNPYTISLLVAFRCNAFISQGRNFSIETVFSSEQKLELIRMAKRRGYKVYIYAISTENPIINIARIQNRVADGGHNVPKNKVLKRYSKSMKNIARAIKLVDRAFLWDNSKMLPEFIASYNNGVVVTKVDDTQMPNWFKTCIVPILTDSASK